jgi:signal transduction histidine kinase
MPPAQPDRIQAHCSWTRGLFLAGALGCAAGLSVQATAAQSAQYREVSPPVAAKPTPEAEAIAAELGVGFWIWTTNFAEKQYCRVWRSFTVPSTKLLLRADLRITADNLYRLYLDGREIGEGGNWRSLTEYDLRFLLQPGLHVLAVEALNDALEGGIIAGLRMQFEDGERMDILSDSSWRVVPNDARRWQKQTHPEKHWPAATEVGVIGQAPWWLRPISILPVPAHHPPELHFWQTAWFMSVVLGLCLVALALSVRLAARLAVQTRAHKMLELERARIARDIHDDLGAGLTQLVLQGEVAQTEFPEGSPARVQLDQLCERARAASHALDEVVWAVNSKRDTLWDFTSYLCKYAQNFLGTTPIRCRLDVQTDMPASGLDLPVRRGLLLAVKEALNNAAKHSEASELFLRIHCEVSRSQVVVVVEDNGKGFDAAAVGTEGNGLTNMQQRLAEMGGECRVFSVPGGGCRVEFRMPLTHLAETTLPGWRRFLRRQPKPRLSET